MSDEPDLKTIIKAADAAIHAAILDPFENAKSFGEAAVRAVYPLIRESFNQRHDECEISAWQAGFSCGKIEGIKETTTAFAGGQALATPAEP